MANAPKKPEVGMTVTVRGMVCTIVKVYDYRAIDVVDDATGRAFRISGLYWE